MSKPTRHTATSYAAKYLEGPQGNLNRLLRYLRMCKRKGIKPALKRKSG